MIFAKDLEETVIGSILMDPDGYDKTSFLTEKMFYTPKCQLIYAAMNKLRAENLPIDIKLVTQKLKELDTIDMVGGLAAVLDLTKGIASTHNVEYHGRIIQEKYIKRQLYDIANNLLSDAMDETLDVFDLLDKYTHDIESLNNIENNQLTPHFRLSEARDMVYKAVQKGTGLSGISTGYRSLDSFTGGLMPGDLTIIAGPPGTFKSAISLALLHNANRDGIATLMFEQEMSGPQVGIREIAMQTGIPTETLQTGRLNDSQLKLMEEGIGQLEKRRVFIDLASGITVGKIKSTVRKMKKEEGIGLVIIDYLQLMNLEIKKFGGQEQAIDNTVRELKILAKNEDIPIILLSGFTKEGRTDYKNPPSAAFLKGSSAIEAHADRVWLLWNPAQYDPNFYYDFGNGDGISCAGRLGIVHAKNRQGRTGIQFINVSAENNRFSDI